MVEHASGWCKLLQPHEMDICKKLWKKKEFEDSDSVLLRTLGITYVWVFIKSIPIHFHLKIYNYFLFGKILKKKKERKLVYIYLKNKLSYLKDLRNICLYYK